MWVTIRAFDWKKDKALGCLNQKRVLENILITMMITHHGKNNDLSTVLPDNAGA
jgi:hypothetical protein